MSPETDGLYTVDEVLKGLSSANAALTRFGLLYRVLLATLHGFQRELRAQKLAELKQTTISDHFKSSSK